MLQPSPVRVGPSRTGNDEDRDGELPARGPDFRHGLPNVPDLIGRGLVSRCAKPRRLRVSLDCWGERLDSLAERDAKQPENTHRRQQGNESRYPRHFMCIVLMRGINQHETGGSLRVIGSKDTNVETRDGFPGEHDWSGNPATREEFGQLIGDAACCTR